ncbi:transcription factor TFIIIB component B'' homolog Bdp1 [Musca autumnalis]|uniref:transcription factor TFIIIB component B'' homolog Bdp1 n=1 Tax=Musca autumnalis TaxID=221902 RepID=UPI003CF8F2A7
MAMRRPRIKVQANIALNSKRKPKVADVKTEKAAPPTGSDGNEASSEACEKSNEAFGEQNVAQGEPTSTAVEDGGQTVEKPNEAKEVNSADSIDSSARIDTTASDNNNSHNNAGVVSNDKTDINNVLAKANDSEVVAINSASKTGEKENSLDNNNTQKDDHDASTFKCPPKVEYQRSTSHSSNNNGTDDVFYSDIEESALHMASNGNDFPMSPSKNQQQSRQRIKATPVFGQRRNSFVGSSPSPHTSTGEENANGGEFAMPTPPRRERHMSGSMSTHSNSSSSHYHHTPHKYLPNGVVAAGMSRVRTESGCSVFSDSNVSTHKSNRRTDEHKLNLRREFAARFSNGVPDKSALKMSDLIFYNPSTNPMERKPNPNIKLENGDKTEGEGGGEGDENMKKEKDTEKCGGDADKEEAMPVPQLKLNSNGELILDDKSLVIETTAEQEARKVLANSSLIYLDENTGMNGFYSRQKRTRDWPSAETIKFYRCLQTVGTDFSLMVPLFPNRTRRDLKLKFKKEERINGHLINKALLYPKTFNVEELKQQMEEEDKQREEEAERIRQLKENAVKEMKKRKTGRSHADRTLKDDGLYQNENKQVTKKPRTSKKKDNNKLSEELTAAAIPAETPGEPIPTPVATENNANDTQIANEHTTTTNPSITTTPPTTNPNITTTPPTTNPNITTTPSTTNEVEAIPSSHIKTETEKVRRRRRRGPNIKKEKVSVPQVSNPNDEITNEDQQPPEQHDHHDQNSQHSNSAAALTSAIKVENVKNEPLPLYPTKTEYCNDDDYEEQIENDVNLLLHSEMIEEDGPPSEPTTNANMNSPLRKKFISVPLNESPSSNCSSSNSRFLVIDDNYCDEPMDIDAPYEGRTFVNLDDGSLTRLDTFAEATHRATPPQQPQPPQNYEQQPARINQPTPSPSPPPALPQSMSPMMPPSPSIPPPSPQHNYLPPQSPHINGVMSPPDLTSHDTNCSIASERELNEQDIQRILTELAEGSLVLVSTLDPDDPDKVLNEIFMVDKNTGDLCDEPLNIPDNIVQCILSVMS